MRIIAYQPDEFSANLKSTKDLYDFIQLEDDLEGVLLSMDAIASRM